LQHPALQVQQAQGVADGIEGGAPFLGCSAQSLLCLLVRGDIFSRKEGADDLRGLISDDGIVEGNDALLSGLSHYLILIVFHRLNVAGHKFLKNLFDFVAYRGRQTYLKPVLSQDLLLLVS